MKPKSSFLSVNTSTRKIDCWCLFTDMDSHSHPRELASGQMCMLLGSFIETIKQWRGNAGESANIADAASIIRPDKLYFGTL